MSPRRAALVTLAAMVPITAVLTLVSSSLVPIQVSLTARWLCDAPYTDPFVVSDRVGKGTNYTLYCTGSRGERQNAGWMDPFLITWAVYYLILSPITSLTVLFRKALYRTGNE
ncbi:hypothetical protein HUT06_40050 [Actinomadura sp. NAK00032]|uniref:hypothetical protein n=1 Tax=Actinomadura sp. NAK00032 TaxID=2742128 RepID=UPI0015918387|nr:hypothetical protein [Actinomadura sp. NAK00032]QKW39465.1 hypothetical protein HUT06_40050 [Actinomadura sp. NAK00032]